MKTTSKNYTVLNFTTKEILENVRESFNDNLWDTRPRTTSMLDHDNSKRDLCREIQNLNSLSTALILGDENAIRREFQNGGTMYMVGSEAMNLIQQLDIINASFELHITDHLNRTIIINRDDVQY